MGTRGQLPVTWEGRMQEYVKEKGERRFRILEHARREFTDINKWKFF